MIRNLLEKYFQAPEDNRADIVKVIGGLLGMSHDQIRQVRVSRFSVRVRVLEIPQYLQKSN